MCVSPDEALIEKIESLPFDIIQIHKELRPEVLKKITRPVWAAVNITEAAELERTDAFFKGLEDELKEKIKGIVVDAKNFGSGVTFDWQKSLSLKENYESIFKGRAFILAGGLNPSNVREGIEFFSPDVVDVSSGVEGEDGKNEKLIEAFVSNVRK